MKRRSRLLMYFFIIMIGFAAWGIYAYYVTNVKHMGYPYNSFLFNPLDRFMDFYNVNKMVSERRPYDDFFSSYPPFALVLAYPFSLFLPYSDYEYPVHGVMNLPEAKLSVGIFFGIFTLWILIAMFRYIQRCKIVSNPVLTLVISILLLIAAPCCFMIDRGNYLIMCIACMMMFILLYDVNETLAGVFLGLAAALKIYPVFLLTLLFVDRKWNMIKVTILTGGFVTAVSFLFFDGELFYNMLHFYYAISSFGAASGPVAAYVHYCVGLTSLLKVPFLVWNGFEIPDTVPLTLIYIVIGTGLTVWSIIHLWNEKEFAKKFMILTCLMVFLTPNSYLYNGTYMLPACVVYLCHDRTEKKYHDIVYILIMGLFMIPKAYVYIFPEHLINIAVPIDGLLLLGIILYYNILDGSTRSKGMRREESDLGFSFRRI